MRCATFQSDLPVRSRRTEGLAGRTVRSCNRRIAEAASGYIAQPQAPRGSSKTPGDKYRTTGNIREVLAFLARRLFTSRCFYPTRSLNKHLYDILQKPTYTSSKLFIPKTRLDSNVNIKRGLYNPPESRTSENEVTLRMFIGKCLRSWPTPLHWRRHTLWTPFSTLPGTLVQIRTERDRHTIQSTARSVVVRYGEGFDIVSWFHLKIFVFKFSNERAKVQLKLTTTSTSVPFS